MTATGGPPAALRRYRGPMVDSARWQRFAFRPGDVVISTPSKCGTTWMQHIVGMLLLDGTDLGAPLSQVSPWLDALTRSEAEVFALLQAQGHRRFVKTHTPLDGVPLVDGVHYVSVIRHPLDVALSDLDHDRNSVDGAAGRLRDAVIAAEGGSPWQWPPGWSWPPEGDDPRERLLWFVAAENPSTGSGPHGLADYCDQVRATWARRHRANVHLVHYQDLWDDLAGEMRRVAGVLEVDVDEDLFARQVEAATLESMRARAHDTAPEAQHGFWRSPADFFRRGGRRDWARHLRPAEVAAFDVRLDALAGDAAAWVRNGRAALAGT